MQDLWADFADKPAFVEEQDRGGGLRQRRLSEQAVLMALRMWLLQEYMLPYGTSLGSTRIFRHCYWIDGLGNVRAPSHITPLPALEEGEAGDRHARKKQVQSPLPAQLLPVATAARQLARLDRPITLHGLAFDSKNSKRKTSSERHKTEAPMTDTLALPKEHILLSSTWPALAPRLLPTIEQSAAIFLLNPLKDSLFRHTDLLPLYQRTAPTELFLCLSHKQMETRLLPVLHQAEGAAALTNMLRSDRWKSLLTREPREGNAELIIQGLIKLLAESMKPHFLSVQALPFPVHTRLALVEKAPYSLLFATRRQDSLYSLNEAVSSRTRQLLIESQQGVLNEAWFTSQREEQASQWKQTLYQEALALGRAQRIRRWPDLRQQLLLAHFGQAPLQEYDQIILKLLEQGEVRCEWRKRSQETTDVPVPGNEDLLLWR